MNKKNVVNEVKQIYVSMTKHPDIGRRGSLNFCQPNVYDVREPKKTELPVYNL